MDEARQAYLASQMSNDLVTIKEAAKMVDRSVSTVRKWIKEGNLEAIPRNPLDPKSNKLLSSTELLAYAATAGKATKPARRSKQVTKDVLKAELAGQTALVGALQAQVSLCEGQMSLLEGKLSAIEESKRIERERAEEWKDRAIAAEAELKALRMQMGLPWWKRLLTVSPDPLLVQAPAR